jgi:polysaccharide export outer membrane protein
MEMDRKETTARHRPRFAPALVALLLLLAGLPLVAGEQEPGPPETRLVMPQPYRICCGDTLQVVQAMRDTVYRTNVIVRTDGMISLPLVDDVPAAGLRVDELAADLRERFTAVYRHPKIDVILLHSISARAFVGGEVDHVGIISLRTPVTVLEALVMAGGVRSHGNLSRVVVVRKKSPVDTEFFELDLTDPAEAFSESGMFYLAAGDLVLVPMRGVSRVRLWVSQYVNQTLPLFLTTDFQYFFNWINLQRIYPDQVSPLQSRVP